MRQGRGPAGSLRAGITTTLRTGRSLIAPAVGVMTVVATVAAGAVAPASSASVPARFSFTGAGYGHGVGMSQYGARAQAAGGRSAGRILTSYYSGTRISSLRDAGVIRVQILTAGRARITSSTVSGSAGGGFRLGLGGDTLAGYSGDEIEVVPHGSGLKATLRREAGGSLSATGSYAVVRWQGTKSLPGPATVVDVAGAGGRYRYGRLDLRRIGGRVNVVARMSLHSSYLFGIAEMPSSWPAPALQAQAIAARTYAYKARSRGVRSSCGCHVYDEVTSQKFTGWRKQSETTGGTRWGTRWTGAVRATAPTTTTGKVITSGGTPIDAFYFSSSGGRTENSEDVWSARLPYARSVRDTWSLGSANPMASWTRTATQGRLAGLFGLGNVQRLTLTGRTTGGSTQWVTATSSTGRTARLSGSRVRSALGLPSTWIRSVRGA